MLFKIKNTVKELAQTAVFMAEDVLGSNTGRMKKDMAVNYIAKNLPVPSLIKPLIAKLLSSFIDDAVEFAVLYMNKLNSAADTGEINNEL